MEIVGIERESHDLTQSHLALLCVSFAGLAYSFVFALASRPTLQRIMLLHSFTHQRQIARDSTMNGCRLTEKVLSLKDGVARFTHGPCLFTPHKAQTQRRSIHAKDIGERRTHLRPPTYFINSNEGRLFISRCTQTHAHPFKGRSTTFSVC